MRGGCAVLRDTGSPRGCTYASAVLNEEIDKKNTCVTHPKTRLGRSPVVPRCVGCLQQHPVLSSQPHQYTQAVSVLLPYPREIEMLWSQTARQSRDRMIQINIKCSGTGIYVPGTWYIILQGTISKKDQISLVKLSEYVDMVGFCVYRASYLLWSPVVLIVHTPLVRYL